MSEKYKLYAAYGSNMNLEHMAHRCPKAQLMGVGYLTDNKLTFRGMRKGVANIEFRPGGKIPVVLWNITADCERSLDRYEGFPKFYTKQRTEVVFQGEHVDALVYVMTRPYKDAFNYPEDDYLNTIRQGYIQNGIDDSTLTNAVQEIVKELERNNS